MAESGIRELIIENRHSGERLAMRRVGRDLTLNSRQRFDTSLPHGLRLSA